MVKERILILCIWAAVVITTGCKKEKTVATPDIDNPPGKEQFPQWLTYNTDNSALPNNQINAIVIGNNDTKWIGTANGLARIQDNALTVFNNHNSALPSAFIQALAVENNGTVWIGTDKGLAKFNGVTWAVYNTTNSPLTSNGIKCIVHDPKHQTTWICTEEELINVNNAGQFEYIVEAKVIQSMAVDHNGALWMGVFNDFAFIGLIKKFDNGKWTSYRLDQLRYTSALPYAIGVSNNNQVFALLAGTVVKSVIRFNGSTWEEVERPEKVRGLKALVLEDDKVWVGGSTLSQFGNKNASLISLPNTDSPILSMAIDTKGRKWLGTYYGGIVVYNNK
jgi:ligand-binding sensor domain-containing protein